METIKFKKETHTLQKFFEVYCHNKHKKQMKINKSLIYNNEEIYLDLELCKECTKKIDYCFERLLECPHKQKPRCRTCKNPCYGKQEWKETAKVMKYSGIRLGLTSIKKFFKK